MRVKLPALPPWWRGRVAVLLSLLSLALRLPAAAQAPAPDTAATAAAVAAAGRTYAAALGTEQMLYDGPEYVDYTTPGTRGHQFWEQPQAQTGSVMYRGGTFADVPLNYDLLRDELLLFYPSLTATIVLPAAHVAGFTLGSRRFVRLVGDTLAGALPTGYYELLAEGPVRLLARHRKQVHQTIISQALTLEYQQTDELFVRTPTITTTVTSLKKLLALLPAHQTELQRYARQQHLSFKPTDRAASAGQLLRYYYSL
ncbi:hypothetical protein [Hymenobacter psoromatis]|uniref:hypothetical protein n=1 Tax=Hymenobacter psoromatis TaxID=1484116 RepID=UPI001CBD74CC|nr:hypothetical protein [Hymenobacter psoromatis]